MLFVCYYYEITKKLPTKKAEKENARQIIESSCCRPSKEALNDSAIKISPRRYDVYVAKTASLGEIVSERKSHHDSRCFVYLFARER